jgi:hypothetical protein
LTTYFSKAGTVFKAKVYKNADATLKGDALVTYSDDAAADKAVVLLNRQEIRSGFAITVTKADFNQSQKKAVTVRPSITHIFTRAGGLGINFSDEWEIEEVEVGLANICCSPL